LKELGDLRELVKTMPEIESKFNKLKEINEKILDAIEKCRLGKEKVVRFISIQSEISEREKLKYKAKKQEDKYKYEEEIKNLNNEKTEIYKILGLLSDILERLDRREYSHSNKIVDISLEYDRSDINRYWNGFSRLIDREKSSNFKCISDYIVRLTNGLENYKKEYDDITKELDSLKKKNSRILDIEKEIDKI